MMKKTTCLLAAAFLLSACTTMKLTEGGEKIRILDPNEVSSCKNLGRTNTAVTAKVIFERPAEAVAKELEMVARNSAARMGGDTIVPLTVIENGQQTFVVYKCINPDG
jgi:starvation-inducible outer membrane lipoprotein